MHNMRRIIGYVGVNVIWRDAGHHQKSNVFQKRRENRITPGRRPVDRRSGMGLRPLRPGFHPFIALAY